MFESQKPEVISGSSVAFAILEKSITPTRSGKTDPPSAGDTDDGKKDGEILYNHALFKCDSGIVVKIHKNMRRLLVFSEGGRLASYDPAGLSQIECALHKGSSFSALFFFQTKTADM